MTPLPQLVGGLRLANLRRLARKGDDGLLKSKRAGICLAGLSTFHPLLLNMLIVSADQPLVPSSPIAVVFREAFVQRPEAPRWSRVVRVRLIIQSFD